MTDTQRRNTATAAAPIPATGLSWRDFFVRLGEGSLPSAANASAHTPADVPEPDDR